MKRGYNVPMEALLISSAGLAFAQNAVNLLFCNTQPLRKQHWLLFCEDTLLHIS